MPVFRVVLAVAERENLHPGNLADLYRFVGSEGDIVFGLACHAARAATVTLVKIYRHSKTNTALRMSFFAHRLPPYTRRS